MVIQERRCSAAELIMISRDLKISKALIHTIGFKFTNQVIPIDYQQVEIIHLCEWMSILLFFTERKAHPPLVAGSEG
jgi:hypothetical protein